MWLHFLTEPPLNLTPSNKFCGALLEPEFNLAVRLFHAVFCCGVSHRYVWTGLYLNEQFEHPWNPHPFILRSYYGGLPGSRDFIFSRVTLLLPFLGKSPLSYDSNAIAHFSYPWLIIGTILLSWVVFMASSPYLSQDMVKAQTSDLLSQILCLA